MASPQAYWQRVRSLEKQLLQSHPTGSMFVKGVTNFERNALAGLATQVAVSLGAKLITDGTHVVATREDIDAFHRQGAQNLAQSQAQELRSFGLTKVTLAVPTKAK